MKKSLTLNATIIAIIIILIITGVIIVNKNKGEIQVPASESKWKSTDAGNYTADTPVKITLKGIDSNGISTSSLAEDDVIVLIDGIEDTGVKKEVTAKQTSGSYASYDVTLRGFTRTGNVSLKIAAGTLTDNSDRTSIDSYVATGINIKYTSELKPTYNNLKSEFGKKVTGTGVPTAGSNWRLFYADAANAYLISDSIGNQKLSDYCSSYTTISELGKALNPEYTARQTWNFSNNNAKAVAYLTDTTKWTTYMGTGSNWAIGGPPLEHWIASFNSTHSQQIQCNVNSTGYQVKWSKDSSFSNNISGLPSNPIDKAIYRPSSGNYWLASTSDYDNDYVMGVNSSGRLDYGHYGNSNGVRPYVCVPISLIGDTITITDSYRN